MILGVIPARGGSKGIPGKNIKTLAGKPLITWSIESARNSLFLDYTVVSTDDAEIAKIAIGAGVDVLMRPKELASDTATTLEVLQHIITKIPATVIVLLQPTCPIRGGVIDAAIEMFFLHKADSLATGSMVTKGEWIDDNTPRQKLPKYFKDDGCVYIFDSEVIKEGRWMGDRPYRMEIPDIYHHDIDTLTDFWVVEGIMGHCE
jgi:CMP-N,N'-diacetyllegionaminic acid synthase